MADDVPAPSGGPGNQPGEGLQAFTSVRAGFSEFSSYRQTIDNLGLRTAVININRQPAGTGVLVGEDFVLTAAHVINARTWQSVSPDSIVAVFDFMPEPGRSLSEIGTKVPVVKVASGSPPTDLEITNNVGGNWDAPLENLDFALLQLAYPPPRHNNEGQSRGHYVLETGLYGFRASQILYLAHCPLGDVLHLSHIEGSPTPSSTGTRIRYQTNTLPGSSGGPIVDTRDQLVAIHQFSTRRINQGVPVSAIAQHLRDSKTSLFESVTWNNVTYLGTYSVRARDVICGRIGDRWHAVADELKVTRYVASPSEMWEWLRSNRKLFLLRSVLVKLDYLDLVEVLDRDLLSQSHSYELSKLTEMKTRSTQLLRSVSRGRMAAGLGDLIAFTTEARYLAGELRDELASLPAWQDDLRLRMTWRMSWSGELTRAEGALIRLSEMLPNSNSDERRAMSKVSAMITRATEVQSAIFKLSELTQNWPLTP